MVDMTRSGLEGFGRGLSKESASRFLQRLAQENAGLFVHWRLGMTGTFA
jgi:hypothetical protein